MILSVPPGAKEFYYFNYARVHVLDERQKHSRSGVF
jgi:hypothetical protein